MNAAGPDGPGWPFPKQAAPLRDSDDPLKLNLSQVPFVA